tara:strand:- start:375 stop:995 length:621 start_codon:yes stop_codon:yes gene_type:complete
MKGKLIVPITDFKYSSTTGEFTCYGNVKNLVDHAGDMTVDGAFSTSIQNHKLKGTMPKMFWMHNPFELPVGTWVDMTEDEKGLRLSGKLANTQMGNDIQVLANDGALDSFSIGYNVINERWSDKGYNELLEIDVLEVSWVTFACNEASQLEEMKSRLSDGELPTKREMESILRENGFSKKQAKHIVSKYSPVVDIFEQMANLTADG